jgi:hypothetical protein
LAAAEREAKVSRAVLEAELEKRAEARAVKVAMARHIFNLSLRLNRAA